MRGSAKSDYRVTPRPKVQSTGGQNKPATGGMAGAGRAPAGAALPITTKTTPNRGLKPAQDPYSGQPGKMSLAQGVQAFKDAAKKRR